MLAQNFKAADELGLTVKTYEGLKKVLVRLETNDLVHSTEGYSLPNGFDMSIDLHIEGCGTVGCIGGWTALESGQLLSEVMYTEALHNLFYPPNYEVYEDITTEQAARALRNYLTTGRVNWDHLPTT